MTFSKPSLFVFDLDNTIYSYEECNKAGLRALVELGSKKTGTTSEFFYKELNIARNSVKNRLGATGSSHSRLLYIHETLSKLGFSSKPDLALNLEQEFWRNYIKSMKLSEGVEDLLLTLRFNKIPMAIVTDLTLQIQLRKLVFLGIESFFEVIVASEETPGDKSTLEPFSLMAERSNSEWLTNVWFVGDGEYDGPVEILQQAGLINSGLFWKKELNARNTKFSWTNFHEIEAALQQVL